MSNSLDINMDKNRGFIKGEVIFTIYENKNEHFSILKVKITETNEPYDEREIVIKGHFYQLQQGVTYQFFGSLVQHPKFGTQYHVEMYQTYVPETKEALINYLSSDLFYGIGTKTATAIVNKLGENAIQKILEDPNVLEEMPNLKKKAAQSLIETLAKLQGFEQIAIQLTRYGISLKMALKLHETYGEKTLTYVQENPYQFVFDIDGFGFITADKIAEIQGIDKNDPNRIRAGCIHALHLSVIEGHVYLPIQQCIPKIRQVLAIDSITDKVIIDYIKLLEKEKHLILNDGNVYLPSLYHAEDQFSSHVKRILSKKIKLDTTDAELMNIIGKTEEEEVIQYGEEQFQAIKQALRSKLMILTGGPGTGKTTVIKGIVKAFAHIHQLSINRDDYDDPEEFPFILAAPTGRAAKRLEESTGIHALTIHRLLGWDGDKFFEKNEYNKLAGKLIIIDEFSMVDTWLANQLFRAIPNDMQVIIVGDEDQLPSVGPGQVLTDLYDSGLIPYITLTEVYRQEDGSKIIQLAHKIKNDNCTEVDLEKDIDFTFIECRANQIIEVVTTVIEKALNKGIPLEDIQVLAPMYRTEAGITALNKAIQELVNPKEKEKRERIVNDSVFRVGDRVLQLINQPDDGVYNGDIGTIVQLFSAKETSAKEEQIVVQFDEQEVIYKRADYHHLAHAYCISIHKAQGSEFPIVILPVVPAFKRMLRKNLLYTAITRSKQSLILCGDKQAFLEGVRTLDTNQRYTTLKQMLLDKIEQDIEFDTENLKSSNKVIDTPSGIDSLSPYDFM